MKYIKAHDNRTKIDYPWMADIRSFEDFIEIEKTFHSRDARCIMDFIQSKDYANIMKETWGDGHVKYHGDHCHPNNVIFPFLHACVLTFPEKTKIYPMLYFIEKLSIVSQKKLEYLNKFGRILININGGFMTWNKDLVEIESIEHD